MDRLLLDMELDRPIPFLSPRCPSLPPLTIHLTLLAVAARLLPMVHHLQEATLIRPQLLLQLNPVMALVQAIHMLRHQHQPKAMGVLAIPTPQLPLLFLPTTDQVIRMHLHRPNQATIRTQLLHLQILTVEAAAVDHMAHRAAVDRTAHRAALDTVPRQHR